MTRDVRCHTTARRTDTSRCVDRTFRARTSGRGRRHPRRRRLLRPPSTSRRSTSRDTCRSRPREGRHQVWRRVDQLDRDREPRSGPPKAALCAVIGAAHPTGVSGRCSFKLKSGESSTRESSSPTSTDGSRSVWMPDDVLFVDDIPLGATGKLDKEANSCGDDGGATCVPTARSESLAG